MIRSALVPALALAFLPTVVLAQQPSGSFPPPYNSEPGNPSPPMTADQAAKAFRLPEGFRATVVAAEPDVQNPIACAWDGKGRLWIAENYTYAERAKRFDMSLRDRVLILELDPSTGKMVKRSVFTDDVQSLTGIEIGQDGIWLICPPQLLFIPMKDDKPSGPAQVVLDGFTVPADNYHNFANGLRWGPDGWLYGRCGASSPGDVGAPGTPMADRIPLRGGLWRYHPTRKVFEALACGTTNPWGHDWNAQGEAFFINTVTGHLWHAVAGMHFDRSHTIDPNPRAYKLIDQHADHYHWDNSKDWTDSRNVTGEHDARGGGHAHCGMIIYDGQNWPENYRGKLMTLNLHGRRINMDRLERKGSGYVGKHEPDPIFAGDPWFRPIELTVGPNGDVFILDWSDTGECHENNGVHRLSGRIYRIRYGEDAPGGPIDLDSRTDADLIALAGGGDNWKRKQALRLLAGHNPPSKEAKDWVAKQLAKAADGKLDGRQTLDAIWVALCLNQAEDNRESLLAITRHADESARAWAIRALTDRLPLDTVMGKRPAEEPKDDKELDAALSDRAIRDPSGLVRLVIASTLQRLPYDERAVLAMPLVEHAEDADDSNLP
ncbi:MAG: PVC-type heme-binding CxxCH protein [Isosphaeraceae bacterium]